MSKIIRTHFTYLVLLVCVSAIVSVTCDEGGAEEVVTKDAFSFTLPNPFGDKPLLETNDQDGRYIGVHIP